MNVVEDNRCEEIPFSSAIDVSLVSPGVMVRTECIPFIPRKFQNSDIVEKVSTIVGFF